MAHILITGGSRGIGAAMVRAFAGEGHHVSFTYLHSEEQARALAEECGALAIRADNADSAAVTRAVAAAEQSWGGVDILINNAGISSFGVLGAISDEEWRRMMAVNVDGAFYYTKAVLPHMIHRKSGRIINISSIWGLTGASCEVHYSTSKAALIGFTRALARELGPSGITVNCIAPGAVDTDMNGPLPQEALDALCEETPLGRLGTPEEIAAVALFLAGEGASFITGQVISPNGGICI